MEREGSGWNSRPNATTTDASHVWPACSVRRPARIHLPLHLRQACTHLNTCWAITDPVMANGATTKIPLTIPRSMLDERP